MSSDALEAYSDYETLSTICMNIDLEVSIPPGVLLTRQLGLTPYNLIPGCDRKERLSLPEKEALALLMNFFRVATHPESVGGELRDLLCKLKAMGLGGSFPKAADDAIDFFSGKSSAHNIVGQRLHLWRELAVNPHIPAGCRTAMAQLIEICSCKE